MDFSKVLESDEGLKLTVGLKWFPIRTDLEYIESLPPSVQWTLFTVLYKIAYCESISPDVLAREIALAASHERLKPIYCAAVCKLLHEHEFKRTFREYDKI